MKIMLWWTGKTQARYLIAPLNDYHKRINHLHPLIIKEFGNTKTRDRKKVRVVESDTYLKQITASDYVILLDEKGKSHTSESFSKYLESKMLASTKRLVFIIGGPYGFSEALYKRSNHLLSLSSMTFTHDMVRLIFLEQLYRALAIRKGLPYHHT